MCGEVNEHERFDEELYDDFLEQLQGLGIAPAANPTDAPPRLDTETERSEYMRTLFAAGLQRCVNDADRLPRGERMDALAGQAIVFARLAGFLAAQFPPGADRFRTIVGAMMDAHREIPTAQGG
jgi:hypothetical protein